MQQHKNFTSTNAVLWIGGRLKENQRERERENKSAGRGSGCLSVHNVAAAKSVNYATWHGANPIPDFSSFFFLPICKCRFETSVVIVF